MAGFRTPFIWVFGNAAIPVAIIVNGEVLFLDARNSVLRVKGRSNALQALPVWSVLRDASRYLLLRDAARASIMRPKAVSTVLTVDTKMMTPDVEADQTAEYDIRMTVFREGHRSPLYRDTRKGAILRATPVP